ncbi:MAG TPA: hypothetical protein VFX49_11820 [Chloroflexota bacterium]|nr:hypothetical protein [Chloroflexota bacterium]
MAADILLPLAALAGGVYLLASGDDKSKVSAQPAFTPGALDGFTELRTLPGGGTARFFRPDVANAIMAMLSQRSLEPVTVEGGAPGLLFKVVPLVAPGISARDAAMTANSQGMAVLGSLSLPLVGDPADKLIMIVTPAQRSLANPQSNFAVLLDAGAGAATQPTPSIPGSIPPFDPGMPPELVKEVNAALSDPNADPKALEAMADQLEQNGFPIAAKALRARAAAIRLKRQLQDQRAGGVPFKIRPTASNGSIAGDLPFATARHYTGDGNRWREIAPINTAVKMHDGSSRAMVVKNGNLDPWQVGLTILLPLSWGVREKPLPPLLGMPKKANGKGAPAGGPNPEDLGFPPDFVGPLPEERPPEFGPGPDVTPAGDA